MIQEALCQASSLVEISQIFWKLLEAFLTFQKGQDRRPWKVPQGIQVVMPLTTYLKEICQDLIPNFQWQNCPDPPPELVPAVGREKDCKVQEGSNEQWGLYFASLYRLI